MSYCRTNECCLRAFPVALLLLAAIALSSFPASAVSKQAKAVRNNPFARPLVVVPKVARQASGSMSLNSELELRGVLQAGAHSFANVDGTVVGLGEEIAGHKLIAVQDSRAVFVRGGEKLVLEMSSGTATSGVTRTGVERTDAPENDGVQQ